MGRVQSATKNIVFGQIGNLVTQLLGFVLRSVFIAHLGDTLVGVNSLYTSILSVLSMAELGIGTALNYSLYKPVANKDYEKIKSYMLLYKKSYRIIGLVVAGNRSCHFTISALSGETAGWCDSQGSDAVLFHFFV